MNSKRINRLNNYEIGDGDVVYWMSRDQRVQDNWALIYASQKANELERKLRVVFVLANSYPNANSRNLSFMITGLKEIEIELAELNIPFHLLSGKPPNEILKFAELNKIGMLIADFDPLRHKIEWKNKVADSINVHFCEVDAHNIVPCFVASNKQEFGAYTLRPKINRLLPEYLEEFPNIERHKFNDDLNPVSNQNFENIKLQSIGDAAKILNLQSGSKEAKQLFQDFQATKLLFYSDDRNDSSLSGQSNLSPYLHFGQIASQRLVLDIMQNPNNSDSEKAFLEELIVRKELSDNYCYFNPNYDSFEGFPAWSRKTLNEHRADEREYIYSIEQLENADTHNIYWNAAQKEMLETGKMHGYMRMFWAKKILEWTESPDIALAYSIYLNDKYQLDGRDPNGYSGVAWAIGGLHDRAWGERKIYGKIRYMNDNGLIRKFNMPAYLELTKKM